MATTLTPHIASQFARLALRNVVREFPYAPQHIMTHAHDTGTPRSMHPIFYGCFDWHSAVHGHWLLARLCRLLPNIPERSQIESYFAAAFTPDNIAAEMAYFQRPQANSFERPYGWAWLLALSSELKRHTADAWQQHYCTLQPLTQLIASRWKEFLAKANYPTRVGTHTNSAFAIILSYEYATIENDDQLKSLLSSAALHWYEQDQNCQPWEPSQEDFLSPALCEAMCMQMILPKQEFQKWLGNFFPQLAQGQPAVLFQPATVADRSDGRIGHLDGLNFSRAWCLRSIARTIDDKAIQSRLLYAAEMHLNASFPHISDNYGGEHWLATFALLAILV